MTKKYKEENIREKILIREKKCPHRGGKYGEGKQKTLKSSVIKESKDRKKLIMNGQKDRQLPS